MLVQTRDAASLIGIPAWQIQSYAKQGFVTSAVMPHGAGTRRAYDLISLVKLAVLKRLSEDGFDLRTIRPIFAGLFDIPLQPGAGMRPEERIRSWFEDKILITGRQFQVRKLVRKDRAVAQFTELLAHYGGLYCIDLGMIVGQLIDAVLSLSYDRIGGTR